MDRQSSEGGGGEGEEGEQGRGGGRRGRGAGDGGGIVDLIQNSKSCPPHYRSRKKSALY